MKYATSPDRFSFLIENCKKSIKKNASDKEGCEKAIAFYKECAAKDADDSYKENDLEYDLRSCEWIVEKCKKSKVYSQNLYAALCNNTFLKNNNEWHCSWRHAGGIVAHLNEEGDYINWYCSGMFFDSDHPNPEGYVGEGKVTQEIIEDFKKLNWIVKIEE